MRTIIHCDTVRTVQSSTVTKLSSRIAQYVLYDRSSFRLSVFASSVSVSLLLHLILHLIEVFILIIIIIIIIINIYMLFLFLMVEAMYCIVCSVILLLCSKLRYFKLPFVDRASFIAIASSSDISL